MFNANYIEENHYCDIPDYYDMIEDNRPQEENSMLPSEYSEARCHLQNLMDAIIYGRDEERDSLISKLSDIINSVDNPDDFLKSMKYYLDGLKLSIESKGKDGDMRYCLQMLADYLDVDVPDEVEE